MIRVALAIVGAAGAGLVLRLVVWPLAPVVTLDQGPAVPDSGTARPPLPVDSLATIAGRDDPFRLDHRTAPVSYDPATVATALAPAPPKPALACTGIVWDEGGGTAVLIGLPGVEGPRVVRTGDVIGPLLVREISASRVVVSGMDTTWILRVKEPSP
ncbi:MAG TPA: hypothetical protein VFD85_15415 [Gemmatimonadales bacterium]|nr:hypothetical protein [Gemmatimonadales bacterium]